MFGAIYMISEVPPSVKQKCLTSKYEDPFNKLKLCHRRTDIMSIYGFLYTLQIYSEALDLYLTVCVSLKYEPGYFSM